MVLLIGESSHFSFHCVAETRLKARQAMWRAWKRHQHQTAGATAKLEEAVTLNYIEDVVLGQVYRDYEPIR